MAEQITAELRDVTGKHRVRRMRAAGKLPAVLYGHGEEVVSLALPADQLSAALRHGSKLIELTGAISQNALLHHLQWDPFGTHVLHVDLMRVDVTERIETTVAIELRGEAPGVKAGGIVEQLLHEVEIETQVTAIPDKLHVSINHLELDQSLTAADIEDLPEGAKLITDPEQVIVQCVLPSEEVEVEAADGAAEPEVIGAKDRDEDEDD
jgi:large subunit ribosomal protein L25